MLERINKLLYIITFLLPLAVNPAIAENLNIGVRAGPEAMDPHYFALGSNIAAMKNIYEALVFQDEKLQIKPGLAAKWETVDDHTWRFYLQPDVKFHNGERLSAEDVRFSLERVPRAAGPDGGLVINIRSIDRIVVENPLTVVIHTRVPDPVLPQGLARISILPRSIGNATVEDFNSGKAAIGTGPFRFVSFKARNELRLEKNTGYWRGNVPWDKVILTEISNDAARVAGLMSGRVDVINYVPYADVARIQSDKRMDVIRGDSIYIFPLSVDVRPKTDDVTDKSGKPFDVNPLTKAEVREALSLAIDRKAISDITLEGFGKPAGQLIDDHFLGAIRNPVSLAYNPEKAKALLAKAGYPDGFKISLWCTNDRFSGDGATCTALGQMFAHIGVDTRVNALSRTVFIPTRAQGKYILHMTAWGTVTGEAGYTLSAIAHTNDAAKGLGAFNSTHLSDPRVDELIEKALRTVDNSRRAQLFEEAGRIVVEHHYVIPVVQLSSVWAARAGKVKFTPRIDEETLPYDMKPGKQ